MRINDAKLLGAFYTDSQIAQFLVRWAIRNPTDHVLDPAFGGGVFLRAACHRILALGGKPNSQVLGVEIHDGVHECISNKLIDEFQIAGEHLLQSDFFAIPAGHLTVDAVVGNPPFIRFQRFGGLTRNRAMDRARDAGVILSALSSSWAPFLIHSAEMLRPGGRLAMVAPFELTHAAYARPVLAYLARSFKTVTIITFKKRLFTDISEDTVLLLADDKGRSSAQILWRDLPHAGCLNESILTSADNIQETVPLETDELVSARARLVDYYISPAARTLYHELGKNSAIRRLRDIADVGIGYVTGANSFFHLAPHVKSAWNIPEAYLRPAVRRGRSLRGTRFSIPDWEQGLSNGESSYLLHLPLNETLPAGVIGYLADGEARGVHLSFKCRSRRPWYRVPHVYQPDAFLSYMCSRTPKLATNRAGAVAPNSLHVLRMHSELQYPGEALACNWRTSLTGLSAELEGHALGGGMLKIEPTEAGRIMLPRPSTSSQNWADLATTLDTLDRSGRHVDAEDLVDGLFLKDQIGLTRRDCKILRDAAEVLRQRR